VKFVTVSSWIAALCTTALVFCTSARAEDPPALRISAAISLKDALGDIAEAYQAETGQKVELNLGASGQLMLQIREGAPVDLFISAGQKQVDDLINAKRVDAASRRVVAENALVLIVPNDATNAPKSFDDLKSERVKRIAIGQPRTVPAGEYAMQVLQSLKIASAVKDRLIYGANVRQVLDYVARGEVDAGIVYKTDAELFAKEVKVIATADEKWHQPIEYPAVIVKDSAHADAAEKFLKYLSEPEAQKTLAKYGFKSPRANSSTHPTTGATSSTGFQPAQSFSSRSRRVFASSRSLLKGART
jgi:molybdate transport system substrate-binding protein